jgi:hypothetical protein
MVSLVVLAVGLAVGVIPTTGRWRFGQSGREGRESREKSLTTAVEVERLLTSWRVRHPTDHRLRRRRYLRHPDWRA